MKRRGERAERDAGRRGAEQARIAAGDVRPAGGDALRDDRKRQRDDGEIRPADAAIEQEIADRAGDDCGERHPGERAAEEGVLVADHRPEDRHRIGAEPEEGGLPEAQHAGLAPEKIEAERQDAENQRVAQDADLIGAGPERIGDEQEHENAERRGRPEVAPARDGETCSLARRRGRHDGTSPRGRKRTTATAAMSTSACEKVAGIS